MVRTPPLPGQEGHREFVNTIACVTRLGMDPTSPPQLGSGALPGTAKPQLGIMATRVKTGPAQGGTAHRQRGGAGPGMRDRSGPRLLAPLLFAPLFPPTLPRPPCLLPRGWGGSVLLGPWGLLGAPGAPVHAHPLTARGTPRRVAGNSGKPAGGGSYSGASCSDSARIVQCVGAFCSNYVRCA